MTAIPAIAQTATTLKVGTTLKDAKKSRVGTIDRVNPDGSVNVILGARLVRIAAENLVVADGAVSMTMTKAEIAWLR